MKLNPTLAIARGQLGVHRVLAELIKRGHAPFVPVCDTGVDILLLSGVRLQIKSTQKQSGHWRLNGYWSFTLTSGQRIRKQKFIPSAARTFSEEVDFVVLHAVEANRFWVVPALVLDGRKTLLFKDGVSQWKDLDLNAARQMRQSGLSYAEIAKKLGRTDHHTVMRRLKGERFSEPKRNYSNVGQYENRWDLIDGMAATMLEAERIVSPYAEEVVGLS